MPLSAYLAKNYLTASTSNESDPSFRPKKRRKRDNHGSGVGLVIADDDDLSLAHSGQNLGIDEGGTPVLDSTARTAEFRRAKKSNWKTVGAPTTLDADQLVADRILAEAVRNDDERRKLVEGEDAPAIVGDAETSQLPVSTHKPKPGLQTAEDSARLEAAAAERRAVEIKASRQMRKKEVEETVYRDASGRRIDISMRRAEARAAEEEKRKQEKQKKDDAMGDVQREAREEKRKAVEEAKFLKVARYADDEDLNDEMREVGRWGDPMLGYMKEHNKDDPQARLGSKTSVTASAQQRRHKKQYQGAAPPNRYGIRPGWRWDGVDRGNGFEKDWFQARGRKSRQENLEYQWQMDE